MTDLATRLEQAEQGSTDMAEDMALALGIWRAWLSKHRRWNFDGPDGAHFSWPESSIPRHDPDTGKAIDLTDTPPHGWCWDANLPNWTESVDDGLALLREMKWRISSWEDRDPTCSPVSPRFKHCIITIEPYLADDVGWKAGIQVGQAATPALALSAALVRAAGAQKEDKSDG